MHAITCSHTQMRTQASNSTHGQRPTHTFAQRRTHLQMLTCAFSFQIHVVLYRFWYFSHLHCVSLVARILLLEHKTIRKQNAGNINENGDFSERLKMKKERVVEEVGMWCSEEKTVLKIAFSGVSVHVVVKVQDTICVLTVFMFG